MVAFGGACVLVAACVAPVQVPACRSNFEVLVARILVAIVGFSVKETHVLLTRWVFQTFLMLQSNSDDQLSGQL